MHLLFIRFIIWFHTANDQAEVLKNLFTSESVVLDTTSGTDTVWVRKDLYSVITLSKTTSIFA